ncbi:uncharacterized protein LOC113081218 [Carassius auratus]|uniref:Uncharacterized protein LOC113081218 n=1 Tax=Carassius auratus TaxID=7957 RepID=A0A6P6NKG8_CARAU|nr:uncharacterized protein LOC113081218 [Carassius auratus]
MNVELLVSLVSEQKELYDKCDSDYKNLDKRELLWSGIAQQMGLDVEEVKHKWKSLRDTYTRKKCEDDCRSGQAAKNKKPWKFMKVMEFLATSTEFRRYYHYVQSNISPENMDEGVEQVVVQKEVSDREEASASTSPGSTFSSPTVTRSTLNKRKRPETPDLLDRYLLSKEARESEKEKRRREPFWLRSTWKFTWWGNIQSCLSQYRIGKDSSITVAAIAPHINHQVVVICIN